MSEEVKITPELAEQDLERFAYAMDLDFDMADMNDEERQSFDRLKRACIKAIIKGKMVINDDGEPVVTLSKPEGKQLTFKEPTGQTLLAMDKAKDGQDVHKNYHMIAAMTGESHKLIANLYMRDLKLVQAVSTLFLGSQ